MPDRVALTVMGNVGSNVPAGLLEDKKNEPTPVPARFDFSGYGLRITDGFTGTDEASLIERSGHEVMVVMGSARNIKITTPADMELAEFFLSKK